LDGHVADWDIVMVFSVVVVVRDVVVVSVVDIVEVLLTGTF